MVECLLETFIRFVILTIFFQIAMHMPVEPTSSWALVAGYSFQPNSDSFRSRGIAWLTNYAVHRNRPERPYLSGKL